MDVSRIIMIRVLIVDDRPPARSGLHALLNSFKQTVDFEEKHIPMIEVVGEASTGEQAVKLAGILHPDVVIMDARMPGMDGFEATRQIKKHWPQVHVLILTMYADHRGEAMEAGADAFIIKGCSPEVLLQEILRSYLL